MSKIYVGNLPYNTQEDDLRGMFQAYGTVDSVDIITDRLTGRSKGFGFVTYSSASSVKPAIEGLDGKEISGRRLKVSEAREKTSDDRGGDRRGGRGGDRHY